jgi:Mg/Co/Ni transporter MgtE
MKIIFDEIIEELALDQNAVEVAGVMSIRQMDTFVEMSEAQRKEYFKQFSKEQIMGIWEDLIEEGVKELKNTFGKQSFKKTSKKL